MTVSPALPWDILFINANLATMAQGKYGIIKNGALAVSGTTIAWTGSMAELETIKKIGVGQTIDCEGKWLFARICGLSHPHGLGRLQVP